MTPSNNQQGEAKGFFLNDDDDSPYGHTISTLRAGADHSTRILDTELTTETESESETDESGGSNVDPDADDDKALLAKICDRTVVYHAIAPADNDDDDDETDQTLCNKVGSYRRVSVTQAREEADRYCRACAAKQDGTDRRPCPNCGRLIGVTYWPQHVRQCTGTPNHPNRPHATDSNSGSDTDATTGGRRS
jgi:hypothetical protein